MCGIVGFAADDDIRKKLLSSLRNLEYRGYDSSGMSLKIREGTLNIKAEGRIDFLEEKLNTLYLTDETKTGIAHTRWATHGKPSQTNAHPHSSFDGKIHVVHNGIIENADELKKMLSDDGIKFVSETDTEAVAHLLAKNYNGNFVEAMIKIRPLLKGSFALAILSKDNPDSIFAVCYKSPLILAKGKKQNIITSDISAIGNEAQYYTVLADDEMAVITKDEILLFSPDGKEKTAVFLPVPEEASFSDKHGFDSFMRKEIYEQSEKVRFTLAEGIKNGKIDINLSGLSPDFLKNIRKVHIAACGSAYHASVAAKLLIESIAKTECEADLASEFRYRRCLFKKNELILLISQSGETADTIAALSKAKENDIKTLSIVNNAYSTLARESNCVFLTKAGKETAVATTKAFSCQLAAVYLFSLALAKAKGILSEENEKEVVGALNKLPEYINSLLQKENEIKAVARKLSCSSAVFFIGRLLDFAAAKEGALKLKEISYIFSDSFPAGELKHGTISLINEGTPVIAVATQKNIFEKTLSNIKEVKARGAFVVAICFEKDKNRLSFCDEVITLPDAPDFLGVSLSVIPLQLLAYHCALLLGNDIDKPRNLAKSVTVE